MQKIKIAIVGLGNCASSLVQGIQYYKNKNEKDATGLMCWNIAGYKPFDIDIVAAFDVDKRKIGKDISEAIFETPNCTKIFCRDIPLTGTKVMKGPVFDGVAPHMREYFQVDDNQKPVDVVNVLRESDAEILINYLPVGSKQATEYYAECAIDAGCGFINCIPVFVVSNQNFADKFKEKHLPIVGDDVKSQIGATMVNRTLVQMIEDRGGKIDNTFQINIGGNTDFRNMLSESRLESKRISKTESISSLISSDDAYVYAGPNGCIDCLLDNKLSFMKIDFRIFGDVPCSIDCKLSVEDSPDSAGCIIDAIRITKIGLDRKIGGPIIPACSYYMKRPPIQMREEDAREQLRDFIDSGGYRV